MYASQSSSSTTITFYCTFLMLFPDIMTDAAYFCSVANAAPLEDYRHTMERLVHPSDPESYAGGSVSSW
jgi:hypothetical protein